MCMYTYRVSSICIDLSKIKLFVFVFVLLIIHIQQCVGCNGYELQISHALCKPKVLVTVTNSSFRYMKFTFLRQYAHSQGNCINIYYVAGM